MDNSLHYLIMANQMLVQKALLDKLKDTGLTIGQPKILDYLKYHDGSSQKDIAKACFLEAGSLTTILNKMEEKGLITRQTLNGNRRSFHIFMTEEGRKKQQLMTNYSLKLRKMHCKIFQMKNLICLWLYTRKSIVIYKMN